MSDFRIKISPRVFNIFYPNLFYSETMNLLHRFRAFPALSEVSGKIRNYPSLWLVFRTRHGSQILCVSRKTTKVHPEHVYRHLNAPLPGSSKLLTLSQGSLATPLGIHGARNSRDHIEILAQPHWRLRF